MCRCVVARCVTPNTNVDYAVDSISQKLLPSGHDADNDVESACHLRFRVCVLVFVGRVYIIINVN